MSTKRIISGTNNIKNNKKTLTAATASILYDDVVPEKHYSRMKNKNRLWPIRRIRKQPQHYHHDMMMKHDHYENSTTYLHDEDDDDDDETDYQQLPYHHDVDVRDDDDHHHHENHNKSRQVQVQHPMTSIHRVEEVPWDDDAHRDDPSLSSSLPPHQWRREDAEIRQEQMERTIDDVQLLFYCLRGLLSSYVIQPVYDLALAGLSPRRHHNADTTAGQSSSWYQRYHQAFEEIRDYITYMICGAILFRQPYLLHGISLILLCHIIRFSIMWYEYHRDMPSNAAALKAFSYYWNQFFHEGYKYMLIHNDHDDKPSPRHRFDRWYHAWGRTRDLVTASVLLREAQMGERSWIYAQWRGRMKFVNTMVYEQQYDMQRRYRQLRQHSASLQWYYIHQQTLIAATQKKIQSAIRLSSSS